ncbi:hypothetical protein [Paracraurococcus lichenis]|uniref:CobQ/CobB/MinD/ParA nucleotide binding domain-containing protein n=1 Tax=Paracraurococcus lichenis TaxID=3064888 RepID=A0ABT9E6H8_9PROT|nr:hypothetical protein [Paracraurococcus sp. LOR1-02]MDO9711768.1 hypothetical protein [Paracraurococcus sp. LOR1-02]
MSDAPSTARRVPTGKKLLVRFGRGRLGGTTYLDALAQRARLAGREVILLDADVRNPSLSRLYPEARVPAGAAPGDFRAAMLAVLDELAGRPGPVSALVDIGGGQDRAMIELLRDLSLSEFCHDAGVLPVGAYMLGPDLDDLAHAVSVREAQLLEGGATLLVMNEAIVARGQDPEAAFAPVRSQPAFAAWLAAGARPVLVRNLTVLDKVRALGLPLGEALVGHADEGGGSLGFTERWMLKDWFRKLEERHAAADALEWLP